MPVVWSDPSSHWRQERRRSNRYDPTRSTGAKGRPPDNAAAEGFFGRMKTESVYPGHWEERTRDEVLALVGDCIRWHDHERIKRSLGWMRPVQCRHSQGTAA
ncbi:integrase core domain-containing protein [Bifidobacterium breve]|uniref:integrase core domain-containing protein n=2 Tax=Bifidobacterium breve TaxID=1685 RepID=UPI002B4BA283|nr:integrase core domain-containing protein [Bifidobacterium breve]